MITNNNSPFAGLVSVIVVLVVIGALVALALSGSDLVNPFSNYQKAQAAKQKAAIDLEAYKKLTEAETNAELERIEAESKANATSIEQKPILEAMKTEQEATTARQAGTFLSFAGALALSMMGLAVSIFIIQLGRSLQPGTQKKALLTDPWQDPLWRTRQIMLARQREALARTQSNGESPIPVHIPARKEGAYNQK